MWQKKEFEIENTGTKGIYIRAKLTPQWYEKDDNGNLVEWTPNPDEKVVTIELQQGGNSYLWGYNEEDGYWYFGAPVHGSYGSTDGKGGTAAFRLNVTLDGPKTGNQYQGKVFKLKTQFEAIQKSNNAIGEAWGVVLDEIVPPTA